MCCKSHETDAPQGGDEEESRKEVDFFASPTHRVPPFVSQLHRQGWQKHNARCSAVREGLRGPPRHGPCSPRAGEAGIGALMCHRMLGQACGAARRGEAADATGVRSAPALAIYCLLREWGRNPRHYPTQSGLHLLRCEHMPLGSPRHVAPCCSACVPRPWPSIPPSCPPSSWPSWSASAARPAALPHPQRRG